MDNLVKKISKKDPKLARKISS